MSGREQKSLTEGMLKHVVVALALLAAFGSQAKATGFVLCYDTVGNAPETLRASACATELNFSVLPHSDFVDWGLDKVVVPGQPYGLGLPSDPAFTYSPAAYAGASWNGRSVGLITAGVNVANGFSGVLQHATQGNAADYFLPTPPANIYTGHFVHDDQIVGLDSAQDPMRIDFDGPISSIGFYISSRTNATFTATVKAYDHVNPLSSDIPILTYRIVTSVDGGGSGGGGNCDAEPCNDAPFVGLDGNSALLAAPKQFRSIVISTDDNTGFFIDGLNLGNQVAGLGGGSVPEPASTLLIGGGLTLLAFASRRSKLRP